MEQADGANKANCTKPANADSKTKKRKLGQRPTTVFVPNRVDTKSPAVYQY
jgi:hypothetical protein